jgi:hypothetical protein
MTTKKKVTQKLLTLLQVAERIRNVCEACRRDSVPARSRPVLGWSRRRTKFVS